MILGAIEISSRSVRFCVADVGSTSSARLTERFHTIKARPENLERLTAILMAEAEAAREMGVERLEVTAGADLRGTRLAQQLDRVCQSVGAGRLRIPSVREESAAVFAGVTVPDLEHQGERVAVGLVGERHVSVAVGKSGSVPQWMATRPIGSVAMTDKARFSDPPRPAQLDAAISAATRQITTLMPPDFDRLLVAGQTPAVVERLCGSRFDADGARRGIDSILGLNAHDVSAWFGSPVGLSRLLPATLIAHAALAGGLDAEVEPVAWEPVAGRRWQERVAAGSREQV